VLAAQVSANVFRYDRHRRDSPGQSDDRQHSQAFAGFDRRLVKPNVPAELQRVLEDVEVFARARRANLTVQTAWLD